MSWYGQHSHISKTEMRALLPPGTCKRCVYWFRIAIDTPAVTWDLADPCPRCGTPRYSTLVSLQESRRAKPADRKTTINYLGRPTL